MKRREVWRLVILQLGSDKSYKRGRFATVKDNTTATAKASVSGLSRQEVEAREDQIRVEEGNGKPVIENDEEKSGQWDVTRKAAVAIRQQ